MAFLPLTLLRAALGRPPRLVCAASLWNSGIDELKSRAGGRRESGAFLLGRTDGAARRIEHFLYYDDIDPHCFDHGIVEFNGAKLGKVWEQCRARHMTVVADIHVHPGHFGQSESDRHNPMIPEAGHLALIVPDFARRHRLPNRIGVYEYLGARQWRDHSRSGNKIFHIGWWPW